MRVVLHKLFPSIEEEILLVFVTKEHSTCRERLGYSFKQMLDVVVILLYIYMCRSCADKRAGSRGELTVYFALIDRKAVLIGTNRGYVIIEVRLLELYR